MSNWKPKRRRKHVCVEVARKRLVALPNEGVDLDEDDDAMDFLNKSLPAIMIKEMSAQQQYAMLEDMRNMHVDDVINLTGEMQHELNQTFDRELHVGAYITIEDTPPAAATPTDLEATQIYQPEDEPEEEPPYGREPEGPLFVKGRKH